MNIEHMKKLRDFIAKLPMEACDMSDWYSIAIIKGDGGRVTYSLMKENGFACGTTACIAGWCAMMIQEKSPYQSGYDGTASRASDYLDLTASEAQRLFHDYPTRYRVGDGGYKAFMLARLDAAIKDGRVGLYSEQCPQYTL